MRERLELHADSALAVFADADLELAPPAAGAREFEPYFAERSRDGSVFFLDGEDPRTFRLMVVEDDDLSDLPSWRYAVLSGSFLLRLPTGRLAISDGGGRGAGAPRVVALPPGEYSLRVLGFDPEQLDAAAYAAEQRNAVGDADWRYRERVDRLGLVGCLPLLASWIVVLVYQWSAVSLVAGAAGLACLAPHQLLSRTRRYREISRRLADLEASYPHFAIRLQRVASPEGLAGGHLTV